MFRRRKRVVGLDLGSSVVKAVELSLEGPEPVITGFARAEIPPGGNQAEAVAAVLAEGKFQTKRVVAAVAGQSVVVRYVPMARMTEQEARAAIRFETDKYLPFELDQVVLDTQILARQPSGAAADAEGRGSDQMSVLLAACKTQVLEERIQMLLGLGLTPIAIDLDLFALANAWDLCGLPNEEAEETSDKALALIDIGSTRTSINVLIGGESCFSREINIGGGDMTQAVARRLGLEPFEAEAMKRAADGHGLDVNTAIAPVLEDLTSEVSLSLDYVDNHDGVQVGEILLSGGGSLAPGAAEHIEQATGRTTRGWNPLEGLRVADGRVDPDELENWAPTLVVAVGLAARVRNL